MLSNPENLQPERPADAPEEPIESVEEEMPASALEMLPTDVHSGDIVHGRIVKVSPTEIVIDVGLKSEGIIPMEDFQSAGEELNLFVGKEIDVLVVQMESSDGFPILSYRKAQELRSRQRVQEAHANGGHVKCRIVEKTKGGYRVDADGFPGFMPFSQSGVRRGDPKAAESLVGQEVTAKVLELRSNRDAVFSHRAYAEETRDQMRKETLEKLEQGAVFTAKVKNITSFGAFVDLGGVDALLHINDMAWQHVGSPKDVVQVGQEIEVKVLSTEEGRISVGLKQMSPDPWLTVAAKFKEGLKVRGRVTSLTKYGVFVEIEPGVEGLIHISEMSWTKHIKHPSELFQVGDSVLAVVLQINIEDKRISLGYRQTMEDPWKTVKEKYPAGTRIEGEVTGLADFGAFVHIDEGIEGLVHISDMSWTKKIRHPSDLIKKGDIVAAVVREVDDKNRRISLSLKHIVESPWEEAGRDLRVGKVVEGVVKKLTDFGAFVEIAEGVEGLVHISEMSQKKIEHPSEVLKVGERIKMKVLKFDPGREKVSLSLKAYHADEDRREMRKYMDEQPPALASMGELINQALQKKKSSENDSADD